MVKTVSSSFSASASSKSSLASVSVLSAFLYAEIRLDIDAISFEICCDFVRSVYISGVSDFSVSSFNLTSKLSTSKRVSRFPKDTF